MKKSSSIPKIALVIAPTLSVILIIFGDLEPDKPSVTYTAAVALLMAIWWITEAVPLAITSLMPVVLFPVLGIMNGKEVAPLYFNHLIFLFLGGFIVALAMEKWNLHKRIALKIILLFGIQPKSILLGFMVATAFLSMWISNTATTMMMVPIVLAIVIELEEAFSQTKVRRYSVGLFLGVAYSASIGGIATLVGTPPNLSFVRILEINFPNVPDISFAQWFSFAFPISMIFLILVWIFLSFLYFSGKDKLKLDKQLIKKQYEALGTISFEEVVVLVNFIILVLLWLLRRDISIGDFKILGWSRFFSNPKFLNDGVVAIAMAIILFLIPSKQKRSARIMDWKTASKLPWHIVLLFGGGFALAAGFKDSGLSIWFSNQLQGVGSLHPILIIAAICFLITFLTELTSNIATTEMLLPLLAVLAVTLKINPLLLMIPATLSASFAFMLPVATPPNAIIFGSERLKISDMAKTGIFINLVGIILITTAVYYFGMVVFDIDISVFPNWAVIK